MTNWQFYTICILMQIMKKKKISSMPCYADLNLAFTIICLRYCSSSYIRSTINGTSQLVWWETRKNYIYNIWKSYTFTKSKINFKQFIIYMKINRKTTKKWQTRKKSLGWIHFKRGWLWVKCMHSSTRN